MVAPNVPPNTINQLMGLKAAEIRPPDINQIAINANEIEAPIIIPRS